MRWKSMFIVIKSRNYKTYLIANYFYLNKFWELLLWLLLFPRTVLATPTVGALAVSAGARSAWATAAVWKWKIFFWNIKNIIFLKLTTSLENSDILRMKNIKNIKYYNTYCLALCSSGSLEAGSWGSWERIVWTDSGPLRAVIYIGTLLSLCNL